MSNAKIYRKYQVMIPVEIWNQASIKIGDFIDFQVSEDGILMKPKETLGNNQKWLWSKEMQKKKAWGNKGQAGRKALDIREVESFMESLDEKFSS